MTGSSLAVAYAALIARGEVRSDPDQLKAVALLDRVKAELESTPPRGSVLWKMFGKAPEPVRGAYLWGGAGRGKTMLMALFFDTLAVRRKRRVHFHAFMIEVHQRLHAARENEQGDPIIQVAEAIADETRVLCFDELFVTSSADAAILSRLFTALIERRVTMIATSNRPPRDLYKNGINRDLFVPFIHLLEARLDILALDGPTDYRRDRLGSEPIWYVPADDTATKALSGAFFRLTDYPPEDRAHVPSEELDVGGGRTLHVPKSLKGVAVFSFKRLCGEARGASDYLAIARHFHAVIIVGIPMMGPENRNEAARFVTLIDALYEYKVKLLASAAARPDALYPSGDGSFEFQRTVSRLEEMQSDDYLALAHGSDNA